MTAVDAPQARSLHSICMLARLANCGECWASPHDPCLPGRTPGFHVARFARAYRRGLISGPDLAAALADAVAFTNSTVVFDGKPEVTACPI